MTFFFQTNPIGVIGCGISDERGERTKQHAGHELEAQNKDL